MFSLWSNNVITKFGESCFYFGFEAKGLHFLVIAMNMHVCMAFLSLFSKTHAKLAHTKSIVNKLMKAPTKYENFYFFAKEAHHMAQRQLNNPELVTSILYHIHIFKLYFN